MTSRRDCGRRSQASINGYAPARGMESSNQQNDDSMFLSNDDDVSSSNPQSSDQGENAQPQLSNTGQLWEALPSWNPGQHGTSQSSFHSLIPQKRRLSDQHSIQPRRMEAIDLTNGEFDQTAATSSQNVITNKRRIKQEPQDESVHWLKSVPEKNKIKVFIGGANAQRWVSREALEKSPILSQWITQDEDAEQAHIMRPQLLKVSTRVFFCVSQYLHTNDFSPRVVERDGRMAWDNVTEQMGYGEHLSRIANVHRFAIKFAVDGLEDLVYDKVTSIDSYRFSAKSLLDAAGLIFADGARPVPKDDKELDPLKIEVWLVNSIAKVLPIILENHLQLFLKVGIKTSKRAFQALVFEEAARLYRESRGASTAAEYIVID